MKSRFGRMFVLGFKQMQDPYYQGFAAQMSFYIMLSLVPTFIVLSSLLGLLDISTDFINDWIGQYVAPAMAKTLQGLLRYRSATTSNVVMIIMALWAASRAQFSMMRIANYTYSGGRTTGNFFKERFRSLRTMAMTMFTLAFVIVIPVYGEMILKLVFGKIIEGSLIDGLWTLLRWPLAGTLYFLMVSYNYYVLPTERMGFREIVPGSIFGAIGMLVVTIVYSNYANYTVNYDIIYGSLASIVALLMWFYFLSWALCLGILFNKVWKDTKGGGEMYEF